MGDVVIHPANSSDKLRQINPTCSFSFAITIVIPYCSGKSVSESTRFYTPYYGGIYFSVDTWNEKKTKAPHPYTTQFYVEGSSGKFYVDWLYGAGKPDKAKYFWYVGVGILVRDGK